MAQQYITVPGGYQLYYDDQSFDWKKEIQPIQNYFNKHDAHEVASLLRADQKSRYTFEIPFEINDPYFGEMNLKIRFDGRGSYYLEKQ